MSLFFACLAPAIGFGALYGVATGNAIGSVEMITSTAACGILYALGSAQPMTIIGKFIYVLYRTVQYRSDVGEIWFCFVRAKSVIIFL